MKYIADLLTMTRFITAIVVGYAAWQDMWSLALVAFIVGILSDAFDGPAARKWPYSAADNQRLLWRRDPHGFDNAADLALSTAGLIGLTFSRLPYQLAVMVILFVALLSVAFVRSVEAYKKEGKPKTAEMVDVTHGFVYGIELTAMLIIMTTLAMPHSWPFMVLLYGAGASPLLWFKRDRITSRSEVDYSRP
jgi:phosphatidylglycerophosphate synthase